MTIKFTKWARRYFSQITVGGAAMKEFCGSETRYFIQGTGTEIPPRTALELINGKALEPVPDGLFEGQSQRFEKTRDTLPENAKA